MQVAVIRGVHIVIAITVGASLMGCVGMSGNSNKALTPAQFEQQAAHLLNDLAELGAHVSTTKEGRVGIYSGSVEACVTPPRPKIRPYSGVDANLLEAAMGALNTLNSGYLAETSGLVYETAACRPINP